jgi:D-alanyl-D-alanine-carboxypeptidase/D-alanyl-D-alanine-endopeptidase
MAWRVVDDCDLGRIVTHSGGYPGYGSNVALLPDKGIGLFAFSNRTYGPISAPVWSALLALQSSSGMEPRAIPVSAGLAAVYDAAKMVWASGSIADAPLGNNVLMDHDAAAWAKMVADAKTAVGECDTSAPIKPSSLMEGRFTWTCSKGKLDGRVQRTPLKRVEIQALSFTPAKP